MFVWLELGLVFFFSLLMKCKYVEKSVVGCVELKVNN